MEVRTSRVNSFITRFNMCKPLLFSGGQGSQEWAKDRKSRPMQQEDEYRLHMELNRCLKKDTTAAGVDPELFESQTTRTVSSRGDKRDL